MQKKITGKTIAGSGVGKILLEGGRAGDYTLPLFI